jgi:hypothetical protein
MTMRMVNLTIHDEQIVKTRKVLTLGACCFVGKFGVSLVDYQQSAY